MASDEDSRNDDWAEARLGREGLNSNELDQTYHTPNQQPCRQTNKQNHSALNM